MSKKSAQDWSMRSVLVTAGPTREAIDPVRYLSNHSSGKMGFAIAACAAARGAKVTLVSGPVSLDTPAGVERVDVVSTRDMYDAVHARAENVDVLVMSAAVADYRPAKPSERKLKRSEDTLILELVPNPDILASVGSSRRRGEPPFIIGFALETDELLRHARGKLERKGCDLLVANLAGESIGLDASVAIIIDIDGVVDEPGRLDKRALADRILDVARERIPA